MGLGLLSLAMIAYVFFFFSVFRSLTMKAFGDPESYVSLAVIAFGALEFIVPQILLWLETKWTKEV